MFGQSILGGCFRVLGRRASFTVEGIESYPKEKISERYKEILTFHSGILVAVLYRGTLIPNITLSGGVVRLTKVKVGGKIYANPKAISEALGIKEAMYAYDIEKR